MHVELDQSVGSAIACVLGALDVPELTPYVDSIPEGFRVPSVFFEPVRTESAAQTLDHFRLTHIMYCTFFGRSAREAVKMAQDAEVLINLHRQHIPVIEPDGSPTGRFLQARDIAVKPLVPEDATAQLAFSWETSRAYFRAESQKIMRFDFDIFLKHGITPRPFIDPDGNRIITER